MSKLKTANENPWYILMTLHGEQEGDRIDWKLASQNAVAWNKWLCAGLDRRDHEMAGQTRLDGSNFSRGALPDGIREMFIEAWKNRNGSSVPVPPMPSPRSSAEMKKVRFDKPVVLSDFLFVSLNLHGSYFEKKTSFERSHFLQRLYAAEAEFSGDAEFKNCHWHGGANFDGASFRAKLDLWKSVSDADLSFKGRRDRRNDCEAASFGYSTVFSGVHVKGTTDFFQRDFSSAVGKGVTLTFANAQFEGPVSFEQANFSSRLPILSNTMLPHSTKITLEPSQWPKLPNWYDVFDRRTWVWDTEYHKVQKASAATLRHAMSRQSLPEEEHFFYRQEMHHSSRTAPFFRGFFKSLPYEVFDVFSGFGASIGRPLFWLFFVWALGAFALSIWGQLDGGSGQAMAVSASNVFKVFGFQRLYLIDTIRGLSPGFQLLSALQTVLGFILLFFLGLGLRTRFRLR